MSSECVIAKFLVDSIGNEKCFRSEDIGGQKKKVTCPNKTYRDCMKEVLDIVLHLPEVNYTLFE
jgi:hypothetical protein